MLVKQDDEEKKMSTAFKTFLAQSGEFCMENRDILLITGAIVAVLLIIVGIVVAVRNRHEEADNAENVGLVRQESPYIIEETGNIAASDAGPDETIETSETVAIDEAVETNETIEQIAADCAVPETDECVDMPQSTTPEIGMLHLETEHLGSEERRLLEELAEINQLQADKIKSMKIKIESAEIFLYYEVEETPQDCGALTDAAQQDCAAVSESPADESPIDETVQDTPPIHAERITVPMWERPVEAEPELQVGGCPVSGQSGGMKFGPLNMNITRSGKTYTEEELLKQIRE